MPVIEQLVLQTDNLAVWFIPSTSSDRANRVGIKLVKHNIILDFGTYDTFSDITPDSVREKILEYKEHVLTQSNWRSNFFSREEENRYVDEILDGLDEYIESLNNVC